jgi:hypothetical protein
MAKKGAKKSSAKRDLVKTSSDARYAKRTSSGTFRDMDDVGRSQQRDRATKAKKTVKSGLGDQGDQKKRSRRKGAKKR